ncbi:MAG: hypothetical protein HUJ54_08095 [Erysipelotrichaceae bacterium]|nr:hypothetical protein [Erysipelotrichaceae bacterium]
MKNTSLKASACLAAAASVLTAVIVPVCAAVRVDFNRADGTAAYGSHKPVSPQDLIAGRFYVADLVMKDNDPKLYQSEDYVLREVFMVTNVHIGWEGISYTDKYCKADVIDCEKAEAKTIYLDKYILYPYDMKIGPKIDFSYLYHMPEFN